MHLKAVSLSLLLQLVSALRNIETINVFEYCSDGVNYVLVPYDTRVAVIVDGAKWPADIYICKTVFRAPYSYRQLYYNFTSFHTNQSEFEIVIESKEWTMYEHQDTYSLSNPPSIGAAVLVERYLKMSLSRKEKLLTSITANFDVFVKERTPSRGGLSARSSLIIGLCVGLAALALVGVLFVYLRYKFVVKKRVLAAKETENVETRSAILPEEVPMSSLGTPTPSGTASSSPCAQPAPPPATDSSDKTEDEQNDKSTEEKLIPNKHSSG